MVKVVLTVFLKLLHVELHLADLIGVVVRGHEHVAAVIVQGGVSVWSGPVNDDVNDVANQGTIMDYGNILYKDAEIHCLHTQHGDNVFKTFISMSMKHILNIYLEMLPDTLKLFILYEIEIC